MILRAIVLAAAIVVGARVAHAQTPPLDSADPSITAKPKPDASRMKPPIYPPEARRAHATGETKINICVDESGKPGSPTIVSSSGSELLDKASLDWIADGAWFKPAEVNGTHVAICNYTFTYVWTLGSKASDFGDYLAFSKMPIADRPVIRLPDAPPVYPQQTMAPRAKGKVGFELCLAATGEIADLKIKRLDPGPDFFAPTAEWLKTVKFEPGRANGQPVGVCGVPIEYDWKLPN